MLGSRILSRVGLALALSAPVVGLAGCGGKGSAKHAQLKPGDMPEGGEWTGVYYSPTFGHLHLVKEGDKVNAKWRTANGDKWGELHGEVTGDLLKYEWIEHKIGLVGPNASAKGKGWFKYTRPKGDNVDDEIKGEWGLEEEDSGNPWSAVKQRNASPDPASVMPDETQRVEGGGWDERKSAPSSGGDSKESSDDSWD